MELQQTEAKPKRKAGRPTKASIEAKMKATGRTTEAADKARIAEFKARLLTTAGSRVIDKIVSTALEDGHPAQQACMKMCIDRLLPVSMFEEKSGGNSGSKPTITINIQGLNDVSIDSNENDVIDGDYECQS